MSLENSSNGAQEASTKLGSAELYEAAVDNSAPISNPFLEVFSKAFAPCMGDDPKQQQFIEIGCGPGRFTLNSLFPTLPPFRRLVAVDKSEEMLSLAADKYAHPKIQYQQLDIVGNVDEFIRREGQFQRLYSFHMLHWIRDQQLVMRNFEKMMAPGGECLVVFLKNMPFHRLFEEMMKSPRWSQYSQVLREHMPETWKIQDIASLRAYANKLVVTSKLLPLSCEAFTVPAPGMKSKERALEMLLLFNPIYSIIDDQGKKELLQFTRDFANTAFIKKSGISFGDPVVCVIHAFKPTE